MHFFKLKRHYPIVQGFLRLGHLSKIIKTFSSKWKTITRLFRVFYAWAISTKSSKCYLQTKKALSVCSGFSALGSFQQNYQNAIFKMKSNPFVQGFLHLSHFSKTFKRFSSKWKTITSLFRISALGPFQLNYQKVLFKMKCYHLFVQDFYV